MTFLEIAIDQHFKLSVATGDLNTETVYKKIKEERISCCKIKHNAEDSNGLKVVIRPMDQIELV